MRRSWVSTSAKRGMAALGQAESLLRDLGITEPEEIDLDAIAWSVGAKVRYRPLFGCEARILGAGDRAIISIDDRMPPRRRRFSLAHELGHWEHHRGKLLLCRSEDIGGHRGRSGAEQIANRYAAELLMPSYLIDPAARASAKQAFALVRELADRFQVSRTAAAIRVVERGHICAVLTCHGPQGRKWFARSPDVPEKWWPNEQLDAQSYAFDILFGRMPDDLHPHKIGADAWFDRWEADRFEVREQSIRVGDEDILTLILIEDPNMLS